MIRFAQGDKRITLQQDEVIAGQNSGSLVLDSQRTRPYWFDGRFLAARDLQREQDYFLQRQADLGRAAGFGVVNGLMVTTPAANDPNATADAVIIHSGQGVTPSGELVIMPDDLTIQLSDLPDEMNLNQQFNLTSLPTSPSRTRTRVYLLDLRPVEFTANPITSYPNSIDATRTTQDGDIVEATAVALVPYPSPINWARATAQDASVLRSSLARQIFLNQGNGNALPQSILPLAMIYLQNNVITWIDPYLVRRDSSPEYAGLRMGLTDPARQRAFLMQYDSQIQENVQARITSGASLSFAASDFFQALPPAGRFPLASLGITSTSDTQTFTQTFFPQQMDLRLSVVPIDEIPALIEDSLSLPPIDLTLPPTAFADLTVFALIPVPRDGFAALKKSLPTLSPNPTLPQVLTFRTPTELLRLYQGAIRIKLPTQQQNSAWINAIGNQTYGFYMRARSSPAYVSFATSPLPS